MRRVKKLLGIFLVLSFLFLPLSGCAQNGSNGSYDYDETLLQKTGEDFNKIAQAVVFLRTKISLVNPEGKVIEHVHVCQEGMGLVTSKGVLTAAHVVEIAPANLLGIKRALEEIGIEGPFKVSTETYLISGSFSERLSLIFSDSNKDIALLSAPLEFRPPVLPQFGDSNKLKRDNIVYFVGHKGNPGISQSKKGKVGIYLFENFAIISEDIRPGESGTPVFALKAGYFQVVGILQKKGLEANEELDIGYALKINTALSLLKEKVGINLR